MGKQDGEINEMNVAPEEQENGRLKPPLPKEQNSLRWVGATLVALEIL